MDDRLYRPEIEPFDDEDLDVSDDELDSVAGGADIWGEEERDIGLPLLIAPLNSSGATAIQNK